MNIAGVIVHARPEHSATVQTRLTAIQGVEVHAVEADGRMVVTIENIASEPADTLLTLHDIDGVLSASLVYHHVEDTEIES